MSTSAVGSSTSPAMKSEEAPSILSAMRRSSALQESEPISSPETPSSQVSSAGSLSPPILNLGAAALMQANHNESRRHEVEFDDMSPSPLESDFPPIPIDPELPDPPVRCPSPVATALDDELDAAILEIRTELAHLNSNSNSFVPIQEMSTPISPSSRNTLNVPPPTPRTRPASPFTDPSE